MERIYTFTEWRCHCENCGHKWAVTEGERSLISEFLPQTQKCPHCASRQTKVDEMHHYVGRKNGDYIRAATREDLEASYAQLQEELQLEKAETERELRLAEQKLEEDRRNHRERIEKMRRKLWTGVGIAIFVLFVLPTIVGIFVIANH